MSAGQGSHDLTRRFNALISSYSAADGIAGAINVCGIVIVLRALSIEDFGRADFLRVAQWFVGSLVGMGVLTGATRLFFEAADGEARRRVLGMALLSRLVSGAIGGLVLVALQPAAELAAITVSAAAAWLAAGTVPATAAVEVLLQNAINRGRSGQYAALVISQAGLNVLGIAVLVIWTDGGVNGYLTALLVAPAVTALLGYAVQRREFRWTWGARLYRECVALGAPFVATALMQHGFGLLVRGLLASAGSPVAVGWYAFAERVPMVVRLIVTAAGKTWLPWILAERPGVNTGVRVPVRHMNGLVLVVLTVVLIFLGELMRLVGGARYVPAHWPARLLLVATWVYFLGDWVVSASLLVAKRPLYRIWIFGIAYGTVAAASLLAIPRWGAIAAAAAVLVATTLVLVGMMIATRVVYPLDYGLRELLPASCLVIALAIWASAVSSIWLRIAFLAGCLVAMWCFRLLPSAGLAPSTTGGEGGRG